MPHVLWRWRLEDVGVLAWWLFVDDVDGGHTEDRQSMWCLSFPFERRWLVDDDGIAMWREHRKKNLITNVDISCISNLEEFQYWVYFGFQK